MHECFGICRSYNEVWLVANGNPLALESFPIDPEFLKNNECVLQKDARGTHSTKSSVTECSCKEWNCINGSAEISALAGVLECGRALFALLISSG